MTKEVSRQIPWVVRITGVQRIWPTRPHPCDEGCSNGVMDTYTAHKCEKSLCNGFRVLVGLSVRVERVRSCQHVTYCVLLGVRHLEVDCSSLMESSETERVGAQGVPPGHQL